jgi:hypothetical protein
MSSKLFSLANTTYTAMHPQMDIKSLYVAGFRKAFSLIDENLAKELNKLEEFQPHGERLMTLKIYKARIADILVDMEKSYE